MARSNVEFPAEIEFNIETRALTQAGMQAARNFDKDIAKVETTVNSIMEPKLYHLYIEDLRR